MGRKGGKRREMEGEEKREKQGRERGCEKWGGVKRNVGEREGRGK